MIRNTFSILDGVGEKLERMLWAHGVLTWEDFVGARSIGSISATTKARHDADLKKHARHLKSGDAGYFRDAIKMKEHWRLFEMFGDGAVCLDIETTGYQPDAGGYTTMVGLYDGRDYTKFVRGDNLNAGNLTQELAKYKYLITYYGSAFDIPFLRKSLPGFDLDIPHFDLCFGARKLGIKGGLKKLEARMGITRPGDTQGMNGYDAVLLWRAARRGNARAMDLLIKYNREDTVNLWYLAGRLYGMLRDATGIKKYNGNGGAAR